MVFESIGEADIGDYEHCDGDRREDSLVLDRDDDLLLMDMPNARYQL
jgi:hypothetical protein